MADRANIYIYQGTDYQAPLEFFDDDGPIDVSSYTFSAQIRKVYNSASANVEFDFIMTDPVNGLVEMVMSDSMTVNLKEGKYQYDILAVHSSNEVIKVLEGLVFIMPTITKLEE
jgi:hypothetical protein